MTDNLPGIEEATQTATTEEFKRERSSTRMALFLSLGCFVIAVTLALLQNTRKPAQDLAMLFDSGAYIMSCQYVLTAARNFAGGMPLDTALKSIGETLMLNGPVLPGLGAVYFALIGREPSLIDMRAPIVLQAVLHGLGAGLLALCGWKFTGKRAIGLAAGFVLAVWPPAIIGAGRFLTETITILFIAAAIFTASCLPKQRSNGKLLLSPLVALLLGSTIALICLAKAALAPAAVLSLITSFSIVFLARAERRSFVTAIIVAATGFCIVFSPWLAFTKLATGEFALTAKRLPTFNMAAGLNPETDGLSALPETPLVKMFAESDGPGAVAYAIYNLNPGDFWGRMARKPLRLFQFPWNDCRLDFLGIPLLIQVFAHQILTIFGFFGLIAFVSLPLALKRRQEDKTATAANKQPHPELNPANIDATRDVEIDLPAAEPQMVSILVIGLVALSFICGHVAYLPFVADSRYGFTAWPSLLLFATWCLSGQLKQRIKKLAMIRLCIASAFIMLAFTLKEDAWRSLFATSNEAMTASILSLGALLLFIGCMLAVRTLLGAGKTNTTAKVLALLSSYLLLTLMLAASMMGKEYPIDWEARLSDKEEFVRIVDLPDSIDLSDTAFVLVNLKGDWRGVRLKVNEKSIDTQPISLLQLNETADLSNCYRTFGYILRTGTDGINQWRAFRFDSKLLRPGAQNTIALHSEKEETGRASLTGSTKYNAAPSLEIFSPTNLCRSPFSIEPRLKVKLPQSVTHAISVRKTGGSVSKDLSASIGTQNGQYHMFLLAGRARETAPAQDDRNLAAAQPSTYIEVKQSPQPRKQTQTSRCAYLGEARLPEEVLAGRHLLLRLTGEVDCASPIDARIVLNDLRLMQAVEDLTSEPARIPGSGKRKFSVEAIALSTVVDPKSAMAMIKISSDLVPLSVSNLRLEAKPLAAPELSLSRKSWY